MTAAPSSQFLKRGRNKLIEKQTLCIDELADHDFNSSLNMNAQSKRVKQTDSNDINLNADDVMEITKEDFDKFNCTKCQKLLFLSRTLCCGHSLCIQCTYEWLLKNFTCPTCNEKINLEDIIETLQIDEMILIMNQKLKNKELYSENVARIKECLDFEKNRMNIKVELGSKVDVLDINSQKWYKGEVIKRTNITQKERNNGNSDCTKSSSLLYIEYSVNDSK